jgi:hypothetical protein
VSSLINPVGPEDPSTYWRRRAIIVVSALVAAWLLWLGARALVGSDDGQEPAPDQTPAASPASPSSGQPAPDGQGSPAAAGEASAAATASPDPLAACPDDVIAVAVEVPASTAVGAGAKATMTVTNTGSAPCSRDIGAGANEVRITSGSALVWSSDFCGASDTRDVKVLQPGTTWASAVTWPGRVTPQGCPGDQPTAQAGGYRAVARNGSVQSEPAVMSVR